MRDKIIKILANNGSVRYMSFNEPDISHGYYDITLFGKQIDDAVDEILKLVNGVREHDSQCFLCTNSDIEHTHVKRRTTEYESTEAAHGHDSPVEYICPRCAMARYLHDHTEWKLCDKHRLEVQIENWTHFGSEPE